MNFKKNEKEKTVTKEYKEEKKLCVSLCNFVAKKFRVRRICHGK
jgi:hypothetical protein